MRRRNRRNNNVKKERAIMIASSVFVLAALTMTGVYVKQSSNENKNDGYSIDFSALESGEENRGISQISDNSGSAIAQQPDSQQQIPQQTPQQDMVGMDDDLDYFPPLTEADSGEVEIPGLTIGVENRGVQNETEDPETEQKENSKTTDQQTLADEAAMAADAASEQKADVETEGTAVQETLESSFGAGDSLLWPINGSVLISYNMDRTVYFATLQQYKYNPGLVMAATEGDTITSAASGIVTEIFYDEELGNGVKVDIGRGYTAIYGQLKDIQVSEGNRVDVGTVLGYVAAPTIYYSVEGCNAYFALEKDGQPVDPLGQLQ